jgi:hypothetical protein
MARASRSAILLAAALVLALALPAAGAGKRKPTPAPPDSAADCSFTVEPSIPDYLVLGSMNLSVRCDTTKQAITVTATSFTRDGAEVPLLPYSSFTCSSTTACTLSIDLFSYDTTPVAHPGDQRYGASGFGLVGGQTLGPASACEADGRI